MRVLLSWRNLGVTGRAEPTGGLGPKKTQWINSRHPGSYVKSFPGFSNLSTFPETWLAILESHNFCLSYEPVFSAGL